MELLEVLEAVDFGGREPCGGGGGRGGLLPVAYVRLRKEEVVAIGGAFRRGDAWRVDGLMDRSAARGSISERARNAGG